MKLDPIIAEIRKAREAYAEHFAGDVKAMIADIRERQRLGGRMTVISPAKTAQSVNLAPIVAHCHADSDDKPVWRRRHSSRCWPSIVAIKTRLTAVCKLAKGVLPASQLLRLTAPTDAASKAHESETQ
jgi:hypothetical protein